MSAYYQRRLPHWQPEGAPLFVTWRLFDSQPAVRPYSVLTSNKRFVALDQELDRAATGPRWLAEPEVASCVTATLRHGAEQMHLYHLHAWVIMCNHVHLLVQPRARLSRITRAVKNYSARRANAILNRTGQAFWMDESYDHWVRNEKEFENIVRYIEFNPVSAGLVANPEEYRWSSASRAGQEACPTLEMTI